MLLCGISRSDVLVLKIISALIFILFARTNLRSSILTMQTVFVHIFVPVNVHGSQQSVCLFLFLLMKISDDDYYYMYLVTLSRSLEKKRIVGAETVT